ncbi:MAG: YaeQ family protein [Chthoniobacteraceae bacterium]
MAIKATIYKAELQLSDIDRGVYGDYPITIARHPSETDERLLIRLLAFALSVPEDGDHGPLEFAKDLWEADAPSLWQKDFTGRDIHWIEVGQPDEKRLLRICSRVDRVSVFSYATSTAQWWEGIEPKLTRARNLTVWMIPAGQCEQLATLAQRTMQLNVTVQDGGIWVSDSTRSIEIAPVRLREADSP